MACIAQDSLNCKYCRVPKHLRVCGTGSKPTVNAAGPSKKSPVNADQIAQQCGGRRYGAVTQVNDLMLYDRQVPMEVFVQQVAHNLAHAIVNEMPENLMVERKVLDRPPYMGGVTEYRTDVVVFSLQSFDKFVETLLNAYGNHYADAAMLTKKAKLRDTIAKTVNKKQAEREQLEEQLQVLRTETTTDILTAIDQL